MFLASLLLAAQLVEGPVLPPGCDASLLNAVLLVERALEKSDFTEAQKRCAWLPSRQFAIKWSDENVPAKDRASYAKARDRAIAAWMKAIPSLKISVARSGAIDVAFSDRLELVPGEAVPPSASHKVKLDSIRSVVSRIALFRGPKSTKCSEVDVQNEVGYAIGSYIGLSRSPIYTQIMGRTDQPNTIVARVTPDEANWATDCLSAADFLRLAAAQKKRVAVSYPIADIKPIEPESTDTLQGDKPIYTLTVTNRGNSTLRYRLASTCACMNMKRSGSVEPGETRKLEIELDTTEFRGKLAKILYVYTNDGNVGTLELPIRSNITPAYRLLCPQGNAFVLGKSGLKFDVVLALAEKAAISPLRAEIDGMEASVEMSPWRGEIPDPEMGEGTIARKGYLLRVSVPDQPIVGRRPGTLTVTTDNLKFRLLQFNFSVQKGIVAMPIAIYFGQAHPGAEAAATLYRPGKPFRVLSVTADVDFLEAKMAPDPKGDSQKLVVTIKNNAPKGYFRSTIKVTTDDPDQPEVLVGAGGTVK